MNLDKHIILILILVILGVILVSYLAYKLYVIMKWEYAEHVSNNKKQELINQEISSPEVSATREQFNYENPAPAQIITQMPHQIPPGYGDPIMQYDYDTAYNPFIEPTRRIPRYEIPNYYLKRMLDYPTRGEPDTYSQVGVLVLRDKDQKVGEGTNRVLRLMGRQSYPRSTRYDYYTMINSGLDNIKIPVDNRRRELYQDDPVYIKELEKNYKVLLHNFDQPRYYPDIF